jgi:plastocyanin
MSQVARSWLGVTLLAGVLALGGLCAIALASPARGHSHSHATHSRAHRGACGHRRRRHGVAHGGARRTRRCRAKSRKKQVAARAPVLALAPATPPLVVAPSQSPTPTLAAGPAAVVPASVVEPPEAALPGGEAEPPSIPHVQVNAVEYSFSLSRTSVPAGKVVLEFRNDGQDEHNLNIAPTAEGPSEEPVGNTPSQGVEDVNVELRPGSYTLFCSLPTHEQKGMKATLTVE